jgi:ketosteroid isomerase-like protein
MAEPASLRIVNQAIVAFNERRPADLMDLIAEDAVFLIPGSSPVTGTYRGKQAIAAFFAKLAQRSDNTQRVEVLHILSGGDDVAVVIWRVRARRQNADYEGIAGFIFHVRDGLIVEAHNLQADQAAVDRFWSG